MRAITYNLVQKGVLQIEISELVSRAERGNQVGTRLWSEFNLK